MAQPAGQVGRAARHLALQRSTRTLQVRPILVNITGVGLAESLAPGVTVTPHERLTELELAISAGERRLECKEVILDAVERALPGCNSLEEMLTHIYCAAKTAARIEICKRALAGLYQAREDVLLELNSKRHATA